MKRILLAAALAAIAIALLPPSARAGSYFNLIKPDKDRPPHECVVFDARYTDNAATYFATYPQDIYSQEGWIAQYYGGVQPNTPRRRTGLLYSSWQMQGKGHPTSGIDFVHAGPRMGWRRSTWEGSSGGMYGEWPSGEFDMHKWYRFVHRVWRPANHASHVGHAGVWMKSLETGQWHHLATFEFPAEVTGLSNMQGFIEQYGPDAFDTATIEFRNCYSLVGGQWISRPNFSAVNAKDSTIQVSAGEGSRSVILRETRNPIDPATHKRKRDSNEVAQTFALEQPALPDFFDGAKIESASAEWLGNQVVVRWKIDPKSAPQLGYIVEVLNESAEPLATARENDPEARQCDIALSAAPRGKPTARLRIADIFLKESARVDVSVSLSQPARRLRKSASRRGWPIAIMNRSGRRLGALCPTSVNWRRNASASSARRISRLACAARVMPFSSRDSCACGTTVSIP